METFVLTIFWLKLVTLMLRLFNQATGAWQNPTSLAVYSADTVLNAVFVVWAGFALWYS